MKYHHKRGIVEKDKRGHRKMWLSFFAIIGIVTYGGFSYATTALNGWPLVPYDATAKIVKSTEPGKQGDRLFIPALNVSSKIGAIIKQAGVPSDGKVTLQAPRLSFGIAPESLRAASPFFNLSRLQNDDQIFLDYQGDRYAYKVSTQTDSENTLVLNNGKKTITAEPIGTVTWDKGTPHLKSL